MSRSPSTKGKEASPACKARDTILQAIAGHCRRLRSGRSTREARNVAAASSAPQHRSPAHLPSSCCLTLSLSRGGRSWPPSSSELSFAPRLCARPVRLAQKSAIPNVSQLELLNCRREYRIPLAVMAPAEFQTTLMIHQIHLRYLVLCYHPKHESVRNEENRGRSLCLVPPGRPPFGRKNRASSLWS